MNTKPASSAQAEPQHVARMLLALPVLFLIMALVFLLEKLSALCDWSIPRLADTGVKIGRWSKPSAAEGE